MKRSHHLTPVLVLIPALLLAGCPDEVTGPTPAVPDVSADALPVEPGIVCRDQLTTEVIIHGEGFSPVPIDVPGDPRAALPDVTFARTQSLDGAAADPFEVTWSGTLGEANADKLTWQSQSQMTATVDQALVLADGTAGLLEPGLYDVRVQNPSTALAERAGVLAVTPRPAVTDLAPGLVCLAEGPRTIELSGTTFLRNAGALPVVTSGTSQFADVALAGCTAVAHAGLDAETCTGLTVTLPQDTLEPGVHALVVGNPETAACVSEEQVDLRVVPPPSITSVDPSLVCHAEGARTVVIHGTGFLEIDGVLPTATLGGESLTIEGVAGCADLSATGHTVRTCEELTVTVAQATVPSPVEPELVVTNPEPAGCSGSASALLALVPPPVISDVQPPAICGDGGQATLTLTGTHFFVIGGAAPSVRVNGDALPGNAVVPGDCTALTLGGLAVQQCTGIVATFSAAGLTTEVAVSVENPAPAGCTSTWSDLLPVVPPPEITVVEPNLVCTDDGAQQLVLTGTGILRIGGVEPTATLNGVAVAAAAQSCVTDTIGTIAVERCDQLVVTAAAGSLSEGLVAIAVTNPEPIVCTGTAGDLLAAPPALAVTSVEPAGLCAGAPDTQVALRGTGFLRVAGEVPAVTLDGTPVAVDALEGCTALAVGDAEACDTLRVTVASGSVSGDVAVTVTNPGAAACTESVSGIFFIAPVPTIDAVDPSAFCTSISGTLTITGSGFVPVTEVNAIGPTGPIPALVVNVISDTVLEATFAAGLTPGFYDIEVSNGPDCTAILPGALEIDPLPFVFFIDPPVAYNGIAIQATIYTSGLTADASAIRLIGPSGEIVDLIGTSVAGEPNRISVTLPIGLAPGPWDIEVTSRSGCADVLPDGLSVTADLTVAIESVTPQYVSQTVDTAVTIRGPTTLPTGFIGFQSTPRAYLNPVGGGTASSLRAVVFGDDRTLTAVVPAGLAPGDYDLIVVNPDASVGLLSPALRVTVAEPPLITSVVPGSLDNNAPQTATVQGEDFDTTSVTVDIICDDPAVTGLVTLPATPDLLTLTATSVDVVFPVNQLSAGSVCVVRLTNPDGASYDYSAISTKNPAQNLEPWFAATSMTTPRQMLGLAAGRPTGSSRFLYAVGGADDTDAVLASVEAAGVDVFGTMGPWSLQRSALPGPRRLAGTARIGRFIYAAGGHDGTGATDTVLRSQILDPLATPDVTDISLALEERTTLFTEGFWYYRIAATFPETDPVNPGGESLPGEVLVVQLPATQDVVLTLNWEPIPGADGYRVYRTPDPNLGPDAVELVPNQTDPNDPRTVIGGSNTTFVDEGFPTVATDTPMPPGSLGVWHQVATLSWPREGLTAQAAQDPYDPTTWYLYAIGGRDIAGDALATFEYFTMQLTPPAAGTKETEHQALTGQALGTGLLTPARADLGSWKVVHADMTVIPEGNTLIYVGPGRNATGDIRDVEAGWVLPGGELGVTPPPQPEDAAFVPAPGLFEMGSAATRTGAAFLDGNGFLFLIGGGGGGLASTSGVSAEICTSSAVGGCAGGPPLLRNWNALGVPLTEARAFPGATQESAFFFVAGGHNGTTVTNTVDQTVK